MGELDIGRRRPLTCQCSVPPSSPYVFAELVERVGHPHLDSVQLHNRQKLSGHSFFVTVTTESAKLQTRSYRRRSFERSICVVRSLLAEKIRASWLTGIYPVQSGRLLLEDGMGDVLYA